MPRYTNIMRYSLILFATLVLTGCADRVEPEPVNEPVGLAAYTLELPQFQWQTRTSAHFRIHFLPGSLAEKQIDSLLVANEKIIAEHLEILGEEKYDKRIDLFYFNTREEVGEVVGRPFRAMADAAYLTVLSVRSDELVGRDAHEIMHVVSFDLWGGWDRRDNLAWLCEGLATYVGGPCNGYEITELAAHMLQNTADAVPLDSLIGNLRSYPEMIGYILMESFMRYVIDAYGIDAVKDMWQRDGVDFKQILGKDIAAVEQEWHDYVRSKYPHPEIADWDDLKANGCR